MARGANKRVLIVDDSALVRQALVELISGYPGLEVMATAPDPYVAADHLRGEVPDVITLDVEMPRMDGITFLRRLMAQRPVPVVVCSSRVSEGSETLFAALEAGAVDIIQKPVMTTRKFFLDYADQLGRTLLAAAEAVPRAHLAGRSPRPLPEAAITRDGDRRRLGRAAPGRIIAMGASTGGTEALRVVLSNLPAEAPPILIVQHMPETFTSAFAKRLNECCKIMVREAEEGDRPCPGLALVATGGRHLLLDRAGSEYVVHLNGGPEVNLHRPSVDLLFLSVAKAAGSRASGFLMTGMGRDGASGLKAMRDAGARTFAQSQASCVIYGMPREAMRLGAVERELDLAEFPAAILS